MLTARFAHADITPDPSTPKIGNLGFHVGERADGQLMARVAVLDDGRTRLIIEGLDALSIGAS